MAFTFGQTYTSGAANFGVSTGNCGFSFYTAPLPSPREAPWAPLQPKAAPSFTFGQTYKSGAANFGVSTGNCGFSFHTAPLPSPKGAPWALTPVQKQPLKKAAFFGQNYSLPNSNTTSFRFGSYEKTVDFPKGKLCINHVNWACKDKSCTYAHRYTFSTKFSFDSSWYTIDLRCMKQVSNSTRRGRRIRQGTSRWEYEGDDGAFHEYAPKDDSAIRSRLSNGDMMINTRRLMVPPPGAQVKWTRGALVVQMPLHWKKRSCDVAVEKVVLREDDDEFIAVRLAMEKTGVSKVNSVTRIQNYHLMTAYLMRKHQKEAQRGKAIEEKMLFHGTKAENIDTILEHGFDSTLSRQGGLCGAGNYFATSSSYSMSYCGGSTMFLCRVLTGRPQDKKHLKTPIRRPSAGFDSVVDNIGDPQMHVVYYNSEAVPEYIVHFS